jgi:hypothetical protein
MTPTPIAGRTPDQATQRRYGRDHAMKALVHALMARTSGQGHHPCRQ